MSSHKEAPAISNDSAADNTDVYAFVSPDKPNTVTLISNFVPLETPAGGPNFFEFGDDVLYEIHIDNTGDGTANVTYQFRFTTEYRNQNTFLYNTGPITALDSPNWNRRQFYTVTKIVGGAPGVLLTPTPVACPPCNIGPSSTPNYASLASAAVHTLTTGEIVFAGQRAEGFYVDLGAIFDLGILRPLLPNHLVNMPKADGVNATKALNINTIAIQVPITDLVAVGANRNDLSDTKNTIGVYSTASRQRMKRFNADGTQTNTGAFQQISRLGNPLFNEVLVPIPKKDGWNADSPADDSQYLSNVTVPELAGLLPVLYPGAFPKLAAYNKNHTDPNTARVDLKAILLNGLPAGVLSPLVADKDAATRAAVAKFQTQVGTHTALADLLRLNTAVPPTTSKPSNLGLLGLDLAGFPNGRRVFDDVTTIELRAIAGATLPLTDPTFTPDAAVGLITEGLTSGPTDTTAKGTVHYLSVFPYLGTPNSGYRTPGNNDPASDLGAINRGPRAATTVPVGAPQTGFGPSEHGADTGVLAGVALAGLAAVGAAAARSRTASAAPSAAPQRRPRPHRTADDGAGYAG